MAGLKTVFAGLLILVCATVAHGDPLQTASVTQSKAVGEKLSFYEDRYRGWYAYEEDPEPEEEPEVQNPEENPRVPLPRYTYQEMWDMPVVEFREYLDKLNEELLDNPTIENGIQWNMAQDVTRRKATAFSSIVALAGKMQSQYSIYDVAPTTIPGIRAANEMRREDVDRLLYSGRDEFGLIVFEQAGCKFCEQQRNILNYFINQYQWPVKFYDIREHPKSVAAFGIEQTPTIVIVSKQTGKHMPISVGVIGKQDMQRQIYRSIRYLRGEIEPGQWHMYDFERGSGADPLKFVNTEERKHP